MQCQQGNPTESLDFSDFATPRIFSDLSDCPGSLCASCPQRGLCRSYQPLGAAVAVLLRHVGGSALPGEASKGLIRALRGLIRPLIKEALKIYIPSSHPFYRLTLPQLIHDIHCNFITMFCRSVPRGFGCRAARPREEFDVVAGLHCSGID